MSGNFKRGIRRALAVGIVPWVAFWAYSFVASAAKLHRLEIAASASESRWRDALQMDSAGIHLGAARTGNAVLGWDRSSNRQILDSQAAEISDLRLRASEARQQASRSAQLLILGPLALGAAILAALWIAAGFRGRGLGQ